VLLTFTGFHDPFSKGLLDDGEQLGPILSLLGERPFDRVYLFATPNTSAITAETAKEIGARFTGCEVRSVDTPLADPTVYEDILSQLRLHFRSISEECPEAEFFVSLASGTPQMHACWFLLAASGELPATLLHVRPLKFVSRHAPVVSEVDLRAAEFPVVRRGASPQPEALLEDATGLAEAVQQLRIVGDHPLLHRAFETAASLAPSSVAVLVRGETGTGKELFARLIHLMSGRPKEKFVAVNCAAIPSELVESFLFGHRKGAFTGAHQDMLGKFELADGGTLFLDELGELPPAAQAKLLRVLEDGVVEPVGGIAPRKVDVRVVAATNRDLARQIKGGKFREDLYYRLNVGEVTLPPLRERRSDIPLIALSVLDRVNASSRKPKQMTQAALARLLNHPWPGNVRDLANVIERSVLLARGEVLDADDLVITEPVQHADPLDALPEPQAGFSLDGFLSAARKQLILRALDRANGNQSEAARLLGVTPQAISKFLKG
jgi:transcriptional regulator with GAF, ATPase, and Fis domain